MPEAPLQVDADGAVAAPARKVGPPSADLVIATVAILLSVLSVAVAIGNSLIQNRMVTAASWPFIQSYSNNIAGNDEGGRPVIALGFRNSGVGPAKVEAIEMFWRGRPMATNLALLRACCGAIVPGPHFGHGLQTNTVSPGVLVAGQSVSFLVLPRSPEVAGVWDALDRARGEITYHVCYCSVFDECWTTGAVSLHPARVKACPAAAPAFAR